MNALCRLACVLGLLATTACGSTVGLEVTNPFPYALRLTGEASVDGETEPGEEDPNDMPIAAQETLNLTVGLIAEDPSIGGQGIYIVAVDDAYMEDGHGGEPIVDQLEFAAEPGARYAWQIGDGYAVEVERAPAY